MFQQGIEGLRGAWIGVPGGIRIVAALLALGGSACSPAQVCSAGDPFCSPAALLAYLPLPAGVVEAVRPPNDLNADGLDDLVVAAIAAPAGGSGRGEVYVFFGPLPRTDGTSPTSVAQADLTISGLEDSATLGDPIIVGDWDGDGSLDLALAAPQAAGGGANRGEIFLFYGPLAGGALTTSAASARIQAAGDNSALGRYLQSADLNGDGIADLIAAGPGATGTNNGVASGAVYAFFGGARLAGAISTTAANLEVEGPEANANFGQPFEAADMNGDGSIDLVISASLHDAGALADSGSTTAFLGPFTAGQQLGSANAAWSVQGEAPNLRFGSGLLALPDLNGDGGRDFLAASPPAAGGGTNRGEVSIFRATPGNPSLRNTASHTISGGADNNALGQFQMLAPDITGDGAPEFLMGAPNAAGGGSTRGEVYLFGGAPAGPASNVAGALVVFQGVSNGDSLGLPLPPQDLNGDGVSDWLMAAPAASGGAGALYVFDGAAAYPGNVSAGSATISIGGPAGGQLSWTPLR